MRGHAREARARLVALSTVGRGGPPSRSRASALVGAAILSRHVGDYGTARTLLQESLDVSQALEDRPGVAVALHHLGWLTYLEGGLADALLKGDPAAARQQYGEALQIFRELGDRRSIAMALGNLGDVALMQHDYAAAQAWAEGAAMTPGQALAYALGTTEADQASRRPS